MKIVLKIIIGIVILVVLSELASICILGFKYRKNIYDCIKSHDPISSYFTVRMFNDANYDKFYRPPIITSDTKDGAIVIFGCSFAFGDGLGDEQAFSAKLSKYTGRSVFNRGDGGFGPQMMLYQLQNNRIKNVLEANGIKKADLFVYVHINDHIRRTIMFRNWPFLYKVSVRYMPDKNSELKEQHLPWILAHSFTFKLIESGFPELYGRKYSEDLFYRVISESYKKSKEMYPNSEFVILNYNMEPVPCADKLKALGIKIISLSDLTDENLFQLKYQNSEFDSHPNEDAWELITPLLLKKLNF